MKISIRSNEIKVCRAERNASIKGTTVFTAQKFRRTPCGPTAKHEAFVSHAPLPVAPPCSFSVPLSPATNVSLFLRPPNNISVPLAFNMTHSHITYTHSCSPIRSFSTPGTIPSLSTRRLPDDFTKRSTYTSHAKVSNDLIESRYHSSTFISPYVSVFRVTTAKHANGPF